MKALIVRELRALKLPALILAAPMAMLWIALARTVLSARADEALTGERLFLLLLGWGVLLPMAAMGLGARLIARERAQREVEFSASWPVSRAQVWAAKLAVGLAGLAALIGMAWLFVATATPLGTSVEDAGVLTLGGPLGPHALVFTAVALALFGLGLLMSTIRPSPFDALGTGLLAALLLLIGLGILYADIIPQRWGPQIGFWPMDAAGSAGAYLIFATMLLIACAVASCLGCTRTLPLQFARRTWLTLGAGLALTLVAVVLLPIGLWRFGAPTAADIRAIAWAQTSPDGQWVCFREAPVSGHGAERARLWIVRTDGSGLRCVARAPVQNWGDWDAQRWLPFAWGPQTDQTFDPDFREWVWVWDMERMTARSVPTRPGSSTDAGLLQVSPDGRYLRAEAIFALGDEIALTDAQLPARADFAGWGDGRAYFEDDRALWALALPGGGLTRIADAPGQGSWGASVSPDERWIAWWLSGTREWPSLLLTDLRGQVRGRFSDMRIADGQPWSPDGRFLWARDSLRFLVISLGEEATIAEVAAPEGWHMFGPTVRWSPDGRRCAVWYAAGSGYARGSGEVPQAAWFVANADGSGLRKIGDVVGDEPQRWPYGAAGWTAAGRVVVLEDARRIVAIDPDTDEREVIFESRWTPPPAEEEVESASGGG